MELEVVKPMAAVTGEPFDDPNYIFEVKWDGFRSLAYLNSQTKLYSRNGYEMTERYPELNKLHQIVAPKSPMVLDGEMVFFHEGKPSFQQMLKRDRLRDPKRLKWMAVNRPVVFVAFDILAIEGQWITNYPLIRRKELLAEVVVESPQLALSQFVQGQGKEYYQACVGQKLEGVMAKKLDSLYFPGKRVSFWKKIKSLLEEDFVVCGYLPGSGHREQLGSLILGIYHEDKLVYQGQVGTGFSGEEIRVIKEVLDSIKTPAAPFNRKIPGLAKACWVNPHLVCVVQFLERTAESILRHPVFKGFRTDKSPWECRGPEVEEE